MKAAKPFKAFAVYEPHWGEPRPLATTIRPTESAARMAALVTEESMTSLYSGYSPNFTPEKPGRWDLLEAQGYTVRPIVITEATHD